MALAAFDLFGHAAGEAVVMASRLATRSSEAIVADRAEVTAVIVTLGSAAPAA